MINDKTQHKINNIVNQFKKMGFLIEEDVMEFFQERADIVLKLEKIKYNKIEFFTDNDRNSVGFTLDDVQIEFQLIYGEDQEGPWYETIAEIIFFDGEDD